MLVTARQHPHQFAQGWYRHRNKLGASQRSLRNVALLEVIARDGPNQNVGVGCYLHRLPAQPSAMISFISSIERDGPPSRFRKSNASDIFPVGSAAFTSIRPLGSFSTMTFSPGCTARCSSRSLRSVT